MTSKRHKKSSGQALVMVTLSLMAMAGLMGLAVDLGWSFFVQKQAQAAADGAALAAVQEAVINIRSQGVAPSAFSCIPGVTGVRCQATQTSCDSGTVTGTNLENGCLYAKTNGFDYTKASSRQTVTIQSNDHSTLPPTVPGINNISYWVTVRTVQNIPQLFSAVLGNTLGTVSAIGTAGIVGEVAPGSFYGMNRQGDCLYDSGGNQYDCGMDIDGSNGGGSNLQCGTVRADVCAPAGIILASDCNPSSIGGCSKPYGGDGGGAGAWGSSLTMMQGGVVKDGTFTPSTPTPAPDGPLFQDQFANIPQPPLQAPSSPVGSCGYPNGTISGDVPLGPYQYYSYHLAGGLRIPDGNPIRVTGNVTFTQNPVNGPCQGGGFFTPGATSGTGTDQKATFPAYIFWGGMDASANKSSLTFGPGQYVMAGTNTQGGVLFNASSASGDTSTGTMFVFTDGNYPGLAAQTAGIPNYTNNMPVLYQGVLGGTDPSTAFKNATIDLTGVVGSNNSVNFPQALDAYSGIVWWQDRRNSTVGYNEAQGSQGCPLCTADDGSVLYCNMGCPGGAPPTTLIDQASPATSANHVTYTSPQLGIAPGTGHVGLNGVIYQPRGAWVYVNAGQSAMQCTVGGKLQQCPLEVVTGALVLDHGDTGLLLAGPTLPIIRYKAALIQ